MLHLMVTTACLGSAEQRGLLHTAIDARVTPLPQTHAAVYFEHLVEGDGPGAEGYMAGLPAAAGDACRELSAEDSPSLRGHGVESTRMLRLYNVLKFRVGPRGDQYRALLLRSLCKSREVRRRVPRLPCTPEALRGACWGPVLRLLGTCFAVVLRLIFPSIDRRHRTHVC